MGNCVCLTFCPPCVPRDEPIVPEDPPRLSKQEQTPAHQPRRLSALLQQQPDCMREGGGGVYYLAPPPVEPCSPPVARRSSNCNNGQQEKGQSVKILVSRRQMELLMESAKKGQFNEKVLQFLTELGPAGEDDLVCAKWRPDLPTIPE